MPKLASTQSAPGMPQLLNRLRMRQVSLLLAVEEEGTLRAASATLGMTQPAATKMLRELESALGQPLFDRAGRGLKINPAGACVLDYFRGMRGSLEALGRELQELKQGSAGKLSVGSITAASPAHLTRALVELKRHYPLLAVEIDTNTSDRLLEQLHEGTLDLVIGRVPRLSRHDYLFRPLDEEALAVVVARGHPLARKPTVAFDALLKYPWILQPAGSPMRDVMEDEFASHHAPLPKGLVETASILTTCDLVSRTGMVGVIPMSQAALYQDHKLLRILPCKLRHKLAAFGSIVRRDRPASRAAARFLQILHALPASS